MGLLVGSFQLTIDRGFAVGASDESCLWMLSGRFGRLLPMRCCTGAIAALWSSSHALLCWAHLSYGAMAFNPRISGAFHGIA